MQLKLLQDRRVKIGLWVLGAVIFAFWANAAWLDKVRLIERKTQSVFGQYKYALNARAQILPEFIELLKNYAPEEKALIQELRTSYEYAERYQPPEQMLINPKLAAEYTQLQLSVVSSVNHLSKVAQGYPTLMNNRHYFLLMSQWTELTKHVASAEVTLNFCITVYNSYIQDFPQGMYNMLFYRFQKKTPIQLSATDR